MFITLIATPQFSMNSKVDSVSLPPVDGLSPRPKQLPMAVPRDLADRYVIKNGGLQCNMIISILAYDLHAVSIIRS